MASSTTPRVFVDADVLIAGAASSRGASHVVLQLGELGLLRLMASAQVRREAERNLVAKLPEALPSFEAIAEAAVSWVADVEGDLNAFVDAEEAHPKDLPILAAAVREECRTVLTFNVADYRPATDRIRIERPGEFLERLRASLSEIL